MGAFKSSSNISLQILTTRIFVCYRKRREILWCLVLRWMVQWYLLYKHLSHLLPLYIWRHLVLLQLQLSCMLSESKALRHHSSSMLFQQSGRNTDCHGSNHQPKNVTLNQCLAPQKVEKHCIKRCRITFSLFKNHLDFLYCNIEINYFYCRCYILFYEPINKLRKNSSPIAWIIWLNLILSKPIEATSPLRKFIQLQKRNPVCIRDLGKLKLVMVVWF